MSASRRLPYRPVNGIDVAASALARLSPRRFEPTIDQARRDARAVLDGFTGAGERTFRSGALPARAPRPLADIDPLLELLPRGLGRRYESLRRDVGMVARGLAGEHPSPLITRKRASAARTPQTAESRVGRRMRVLSVVRETEQAVTLVLADVSGVPVAFEAGQFLSVRADVNGETLWRAYSLCTAPGSGLLAITIKRVAGGRVSNFLNERAHEGQLLEVRGPSGRFTLAAASAPRHVVLIGGGSGITPLMSHARHLLASEPEARVTLLYGNRSEHDVILRAALGELAALHGARLRVRHVLEQPASFDAGAGMLDQATTLRELAACPDDAHTRYLVCGPEPMMQAVRAALLEHGVDEARMLEERFASPVAAPVQRAPALVPREQLVSLRIGTKHSELRVAPGQTILEAALAHGAPLDFSCTMGGCGACMVQLREGSVHMDEPNCLSARERAAGKVLTCIAHPQGPCALERD